MTDELHPVVQRAYDLNTVDEVLGRLCETDDERAAIKRVLAVEEQEQRITDAFTPERPPRPAFRPQIDFVEHARRAVDRYTAWVDSYPDDDPTTLDKREHVLQLARLDLQRLEEGH